MAVKRSDPQKLKITGARENNLKNFTLELEHDAFTVVTGLSGSGKSSLAYRTVYAEGQRRYIETFSPYTRQFFDKVKKPDVDLMEHVRPAIAIQQKTRVTNSRSTVGTMTNINDYLKTLWSNIAEPVCPACRVPVRAWSSSELAAYLAELLGQAKGEIFYLCSPQQLSAKSADRAAEVDRLVTLGFSRFYDLDAGAAGMLEETSAPALGPSGELLVVVDRLRGGQVSEKRLRDTLAQVFSGPHRSCVVIRGDAVGDMRAAYLAALGAPCTEKLSPLKRPVVEYRNYFSCAKSQLKITPPKPALFTFNHPSGACPECRGFGNVLTIDPARCVPDPSLSIKDGALQCLSIAAGRRQYARVMKFCAEHRISTTTPWSKLPEETRREIFETNSKKYPGIRQWFKRLERKIYKMHVRVFLSRYRSQFICRSCNGKRLRPEALAYEAGEKTIADLWELPIEELTPWLRGLEAERRAEDSSSREIGDLFRSVIVRLEYLAALGLPYLALGRASRTLSGGETQRVNLGAAIGSDLISTHFVLDEPSVGLHPRDSVQLIEALRKLQSAGNSLLVVEHDPDCMQAADNVVELGPDAGEQGGSVVFSGSIQKWSGIEISRKVSNVRGKPKGKLLSIRNACARNLKGFDLDLPLGAFICLTGVSGSGKSTLVSEVIQKAYGKTDPALEDIVRGFEAVEQVLLVSQTGLAKSPRANIATYSGIWDTIRNALATTEEAKRNGLSKSHFSFNVDRGRCAVCKGAGFIKEDMQFLSDVYIQCEACLGMRFQQKVLEVKFKGFNANDFLCMSIDRCREVFSEINAVAETAETLALLGLGHLTLGHPLSELSGGEAQRLKLVPFVQRSARGTSLLIFDEPTTGLHPRDIERLIALLRLLRDRGHTVLCVEHNLQLILASDWVVDLGPEGGSRGGELLLEGTPAELLETKALSYTADHLRRFVQGERASPARTKRAAKPTKSSVLTIRGAREHNLKNIDITVPLDSIVAFTGVSGSGKSTIAKDIIYAEGQRRYLDCLSPYARQFIKELKKPEIDSIENIKPTICVYQHTFQPGQRSTIATMSEVNNFLRLFFSKLGTQFCPDHPDQAISPLSTDEMALEIKALAGARIRILAPIVKQKKGQHLAVFTRATEAEIAEVRVDGVFGRPGFFADGLMKTKPHTIEFVVGSFAPKNLSAELIRESVVMALGLGGGTLIAHSGSEEHVFSMERTCPVCRRGFFKIDPEDLSFHSRRGACVRCSGAGVLAKGQRCPECSGSRLGPIGRNVRIRGQSIDDLSLLTCVELRRFVTGLRLSPREEPVAAPILRELISRVDTLVSLGLDYLALGRECATLSSGELQRLRLATAMGSPLTGALYIFDEPSAGLHPEDNERVLSRLTDLKQRGNSVIIIEHDAESIRTADQVIDIGPGGGREGGEVVYCGETEQFISTADTVTARELRAGVEIQARSERSSAGTLAVEIAEKNNLKQLSLEIPLHSLVTIAGVSGAGKSSLVHGAIFEALDKFPAKRWRTDCAAVSTSEELFRALLVDQKPIGINSRSTPASYLKIWDDVRKLFAMSIEAKALGWSPSFFSYNTGKGRCSECLGRGEITLEMNFLPDARTICESCGGSRFSEEANSIRYLGLSISDVLALTFEEAKTIFANHRAIHQTLHQACELGLGYLTLGQSSTTLSGGESQRIKLVSELAAKRRGHTLYILDEPTTGLHRADVLRLGRVLRTLVQQGHTVFVIEHDADLIAHADQVIELGPGPGAAGGRVIFQGSPTELVKAETPWGKRLNKLTSGETVLRDCAAA